MTKRPSVIDTVMPSGAVTPTVPHREIAVSPSQSARKPRPDVQHTSVYIPRAAYERLREIAFAERIKIHDLLMEGIDLAIEKRGHSERTQKSTKKR